MKEIRTYVFLDCETTGMPREENNTTKIAELGLIAVKREHLLNSNGESPRVQNKLTLCFNPSKLMQDQGSIVTGLDNFLLEHEMKFDTRSFGLIDSFLGLLTQPVCLIAHNGNKFDYPILKNNMKRINVDFSCDLMCADSFFAFYNILHSKKKNAGIHNESVPKPAFKNNNINRNDVTSKPNCSAKRNLEKEFDCVKKEKHVYHEHKMEVISDTENDALSSNVQETTEHIDSTSDEGIQTTDIKQNYNESYVNDKKASAANDNFQSHDSAEIWLENMDNDKQDKVIRNDHKHIQNINESTPKRQHPPSVKKKKRVIRFPWGEDPRPKESYKLAEIYKRQVNKECPQAHRAEIDCIMTMDIAVTMAKEFVKWVDENYIDFEDVEPMTIGVRL